jgi:hypothetical protein
VRKNDERERGDSHTHTLLLYIVSVESLHLFLSLLRSHVLLIFFFLPKGSFPERDNDRLYNTSLSFGPDGRLLAKHRKVHLFDINIPGKMVFQESATLSPGNAITTFDTGMFFIKRKHSHEEDIHSTKIMCFLNSTMESVLQSWSCYML